MPSIPQLPRILLGLAILLTAVSGFKNLANSSKLKGVNEEVAAANDTAATLKADNKKILDEAKAAKEEAKAVAEAKAAAEAKASAAAAEADRVKKDLEEATAKAQEQDTKIKDLEAKANAPAAPVVAATPDPELVKKVADAEAKVAESEQLLKTLQTKSEDAEKKAAALEAENARRAAGLAKPGLEGRILAVNPNWNFVVLNIGDRQGVAANSSLIVQRGGNLVARLRVTSVEPSTSIADIQAGSVPKGSFVQPGDLVIFPSGS
jgi:hypothetical protein